MRKVLIVLFFLLVAYRADAQCVGSSGVPFNCVPATPGSSDYLLGGSASASNTVRFTVGQIIAGGLPGSFSSLLVNGLLTLPSQTANTFMAAPNGASGVPAFRAIVAADIPVLNQNTTGTAANIAGTLPLSQIGIGGGSNGQPLGIVAGAVAPVSNLASSGVPLISKTFTAAVAGASMVSDYRFGSASSCSGSAAGANCHTVQSAADLTTYFNINEDFAGTVVTNGTMGQNCQSFSTCTQNYVIETGDLALTAVLGSTGNVVAPIASGTGTTTAIAAGSSNLITSVATGISNTTGMFLGEVMASGYAGAYYLTAIADSTHFTPAEIINAPSTASYNNAPVVFTPWTFTLTTGAPTGLCYPVTSATATHVAVGQFVQWMSGGVNGSPGATAQYTVASVPDSSHICMSTGFPTRPTGDGLLLGPSLSVAEIWDKNYYSAPPTDNNIVAIDFKVQVPPSLGFAKFFASLASLPANAPLGVGMATWVYPRNIGAYANTNLGSEIDVPEINYGLNTDAFTYSGNNHGFTEGTGKPDWFTNTGASWGPCPPTLTSGALPVISTGNTAQTNGCPAGMVLDYSPTANVTPYQFWVNSIDMSLAVHDFEFVKTGDKIIRYLDGVPLREDKWRWGDQLPMHWSADISVGSWAMFSAMAFPNAAGEFPTATKVVEVSIYQQ